MRERLSRSTETLAKLWYLPSVAYWRCRRELARDADPGEVRIVRSRRDEPGGFEAAIRACEPTAEEIDLLDHGPRPLRFHALTVVNLVFLAGMLYFCAESILRGNPSPFIVILTVAGVPAVAVYLRLSGWRPIALSSAVMTPEGVRIASLLGERLYRPGRDRACVHVNPGPAPGPSIDMGDALIVLRNVRGRESVIPTSPQRAAEFVRAWRTGGGEMVGAGVDRHERSPSARSESA